MFSSVLSSFVGDWDRQLTDNVDLDEDSDFEWSDLDEPSYDLYPQVRTPTCGHQTFSPKKVEPHFIPV